MGERRGRKLMPKRRALDRWQKKRNYEKNPDSKTKFKRSVMHAKRKKFSQSHQGFITTASRFRKFIKPFVLQAQEDFKEVLKPRKNPIKISKGFVETVLAAYDATAHEYMKRCKELVQHRTYVPGPKSKKYKRKQKPVLRLKEDDTSLAWKTIIDTARN